METFLKTIKDYFTSSQGMIVLAVIILTAIITAIVPPIGRALGRLLKYLWRSPKMLKNWIKECYEWKKYSPIIDIEKPELHSIPQGKFIRYQALVKISLKNKEDLIRLQIQSSSFRVYIKLKKGRGNLIAELNNLDEEQDESIEAKEERQYQLTVYLDIDKNNFSLLTIPSNPQWGVHGIWILLSSGYTKNFGKGIKKGKDEFAC